MNQQPIVEDSRGRKFAMSACGLIAFIVNPNREILVMKHPRRTGWEVPNGALMANETVQDGVLREVYEEAGNQIRVRPLGTVHTYTFRYDDHLQYMISIAYLLAYEGGAIIAGDDMAGSEVRWLALAEFKSIDLVVPRDAHFLAERAVALYDLWVDTPPVDLQPPLNATQRNKHGY